MKLGLYSMPNEKAIILVSTESSWGGEDRKIDTPSTSESSVDIYVNDKNMVKRIAKAFHDAIERCGGKAELY